MLLESAKLSAGKSNPVAYMNGILSTWKANGTFTINQIETSPRTNLSGKAETKLDKAAIERHFYDLRHNAEVTAEKELNRALSDAQYAHIYKQINELSIDYALASIKNPNEAEKLAKTINALENQGDMRLKALGIKKDNFTPHYECKKCNDTGYDTQGNPCECMKKFISSLN